MLVITKAGLPAAFVVILPTCMMLEFFMRILLVVPVAPVISLTTLPPISAVLAFVAGLVEAEEDVDAVAVTETAFDVCCFDTTCMP